MSPAVYHKDLFLDASCSSCTCSPWVVSLPGMESHSTVKLMNKCLEGKRPSTEQQQNRGPTCWHLPPGPAPITQLNMAGQHIPLSPSVSNLGVKLDSSLTFDSHVKRHSIAQVRPTLTQSDAEKLIHAFISSGLDYRNGLFIRSPGRSLQKLQYIQNSAARILVLTLLISSAYKPSRVLRELQQDPELRGHGQGETLKAKYKGKSYRATVGISRTADQVAEFCRKTCVRLECCPNLITPHMVREHCSENCSLFTKTKYTHYYGKKKTKRIGRPPGGHTNLDISTKEGSRRKKRKPLSVCKTRLFTSVDSTPACSPLGSGEEEEDLDEDYSLSEEDSGSEQQGDSEVLERRSQPASPRPTPTEPRPREGPRRQCRKKKQLTSYSDDENQPPSPTSGRVEVQEKLHLDSSPLGWSITDVTHFIRTTDCSPLARIFRDQEIDGQALLLLSLPTVQECMGLKLGPAIKLCHLIERVKLAFYQHFAG